MKNSAGYIRQELPLVSVAIPVYNFVSFIRETIDSVLAQDYPNLEIIISDDGSNDGTQEILLEYKERYSDRIKLILLKENTGHTKNHNTVLFACTGKYIAFLDGDDLMLPGKISKQAAFLETHPECFIVYHEMEVFDSETNKPLYLYNKRFGSYQGSVKQYLNNFNFSAASSIMVRREKVPVNGFDESLSAVCDVQFWIEILKDGGEVRFIDAVLGRYRLHPAQVTNLHPFDFKYDTLRMYTKALMYFPEEYSAVLYRYISYFDRDNVYPALSFFGKVRLIIVRLLLKPQFVFRDFYRVIKRKIFRAGRI